MEVSGRTAGEEMVDTVDAGPSEGSGVICQPCYSEGGRVVAAAWCENCEEYFCQACVKFHHKQAITKHHVILEGDSMPKDVRQTQASSACNELCTTHKNEIVRFYCRTHGVVGCGDCRILEHKECDVTRVKEVSGGYTKSKEVQEIHKKFDQLRKNNTTLHDINNEKQSLNANHSKMLDDIKAHRMAINYYFDRMEAAVKGQVNKLKNEKESKLNEAEKSLKSLVNEMKSIEDDLKLESNVHDHFVRAKRAKTRLSEIDNEIELFEDKTGMQYHKFEGDVELVERMNDGELFGELVPVIPKPETMEPKYVKEADVNQPNDTVCYITDLVQIETDKFALVDRNNTCVKVVDVKKNGIISVFSVLNRPFGIAKVSSDLVVVTIPAAQKLQFLTCSTDLTERYSLNVDGECIGIDCKNNLLALTYSNPSKAEILTLTGTVLHTIKVSNIQPPSYIIFGHGPKTIFISNYHKGRVRKYNFNGKVLGRYDDTFLQNPSGLVTTKDGVVLLCSVGERFSCVHLVTSSDCSKIQHVSVRDMESPRCLCFCEDSSKLYICNGTGSLAKNCNTLKIYQC